MLLAEDLLLLLTDDDTGRHVVDSTHLDLALAGAVLLELVGRGAVGVAGPDGEARRGRLVVLDGRPTGSPVLDAALATLATRPGARPADAVQRLEGGLRARLLAGLVALGVLRAEGGRVLGIFPTHRWPAVDRAHEASVRQGLHEVLVAGRKPTPREVALVGLLAAADAVPAALGATTLSVHELRSRAATVARGDVASEAVRWAIEEVEAAMMAAVIASTTTATS